MKNIIITTTLALSMLFTVGCAPRGHSQSTLNQSMTVKAGTVTAIKMVEVNNNGVGNGIGMVLGAAAGGAAANKHIGGGSGKIIATAAGAVAGGVIGGMAGDSIDSRQGLEIVVKLNSGATVATVLAVNGALSALQAGQAVNVIFSRGKIINISPR